MLLYIIFSPLRWVISFIQWCYKPTKQKFCKHRNIKEETLPETYGLFGGCKKHTCKDCGEVLDYGDAMKRLQILNSSYNSKEQDHE
jgi:hypothetical protein